jgi:hypothetical protein
LKKGFGGYMQGATRGFPIDLREVVLIHFQNLSNEIVSDGLKKEYEPAVDRLMNWLAWEFTEHHPELKDEFDKVMTYKFGDMAISDHDRVKRIEMKERLLSRLLALHNIDLGRSQQAEEEDDPAKWDKSDIPGEDKKEHSEPDLFDDQTDAS